MSTTLRTLICSCRYSQEGDPGLALVLTVLCANATHTRLRPSNVETEAVDGYLGAGAGGGGRGARDGGKAGRTVAERKARSCCVCRS